MPIGRIAMSTPRSHSATAYGPIIRPDTPASWSRRAGISTMSASDEAERENQGAGMTAR